MWTLPGFLQDLQRMWHEPRVWDTTINKSGLILITVVVVVFSIGFFANLRNTSDLLKDKVNVAIGSHSGVVHKKDAPPIPPPSEVVSLRIYPIKSCRGFEVDSTRLKKAGLTLDRNWMFIDAQEKKFLTIRSDPSMTLIDTKIIERDGQQMLEVSIHNTDGRVVIPAFPTQKWLEANTTLSEVEIWGAKTDAWEYRPEINRIFSEFFNKDVLLVYKGPTHRMVAINGRRELYGSETPHHFADVMSLQIASEASIKDLNKRLGHEPGTPEALTIERFRPNIIIRGRDDHPWEEDTWKRIRISTLLPAEEKLYKLDCDIVARCARCQVPNVNPDTAEKHPKQPWDTLMDFRRVDTGGPAKYKPCFGMMAIPKNEGVVKVGATLECLETTDKHWYNERAFKDL
ncbi:related to MOSC domain-containing 2, mitochondrial precursor [Lecanosticta acicola]|uniref:Related to MOSC domain-containing 2, mitochondrial n=1 Tax=Lecanosticta acicola TaxID=111012 RepID=A0AAI8YWF7_9PEZI|nr:related to MOSC domain-containing 2, mitochondrial precursor [Lecanosticta acicola]